MKFETYLTEEDKKPTTKKFKFFSDNPGGSWLETERRKAKKGRWGSLTAGFHDFFIVPIKIVQNLRGMQGERRTLSEPRVQELMASIKEHGIYQPIFINVLYDGTAEINEGNRRALIAKTLGMKYVPVEVRYYAGGELIDGPWHPDNVVRVAKPFKRPPKPPELDKPKKPIPTFHERMEKRKKEREKEEKERFAKLKKGKPVSKDIQNILDLLSDPKKDIKDLF